jgi:pimeloyl-ACP methyl ester carboxylesterase
MGPSSHPGTFVLVHGAWGGGWVWRRVADRLRARGHRVFAPTLTGLGDRSHLCSPAVTLTTHILDVVNLVAWEDLDGFVLCGHSYGGAVITGVAERIAQRIALIVYLDAFIPADGEAMADIAPRRPVPGGTTPAPTGNLFRVNERDRAWVEAKSTPQPNGTFVEKLAVTGAYQRIPKRAFIRASLYDAPHFRRYYDACAATPGWTTYEIAAGHMVMLDAPDELTRILLRSI